MVFASDMLQHNAQALAMVDLTRKRPLDPRLLELTEEVRAVQGPEIETFSDWLTDWGEEIPATMRDHSNAAEDGSSVGESMDGMDTSLPGMLSAEDISALENAADDEFQSMWLKMMIEHHTGAVELAKNHTEAGQYKPAIDLAEDIVAAQTAQIEAMQGLTNS